MKKQAWCGWPGPAKQVAELLVIGVVVGAARLNSRGAIVFEPLFVDVSVCSSTNAY